MDYKGTEFVIKNLLIKWPFNVKSSMV